MKSMFYLLIITLSLVLVGCDNNIDESELVVRKDIHYQINSDKPFTGSVTSYHENGQKKNMGTYKKGLKDGLKETYFDNGQLELKQNYENGKLKETIVRYDESGTEFLIMSFFLDDDSNFILLSDSEVVIKKGGNIIREGKVEGGVPQLQHLKKSNEEPFNGLVVSYHDNGNPRCRSLSRNGFYNGVSECFTENGQLQYKWNMKDGKFHGPYELWTDDGDKLEQFYKDGEQHGLRKYVRSDGSIWSEKCYQNGEEVSLTVCELK